MGNKNYEAKLRASVTATYEASRRTGSLCQEIVTSDAAPDIPYLSSSSSKLTGCLS